jgi:hypothetical protein
MPPWKTTPARVLVRNREETCVEINLKSGPYMNWDTWIFRNPQRLSYRSKGMGLKEKKDK